LEKLSIQVSIIKLLGLL